MERKICNRMKMMVFAIFILVLMCSSVHGGDVKPKMPLTSSKMMVETLAMIKRATTWLSSARNNDNSGWGNDTHLAILALRLAGLSHDKQNPPIISTELQLSSKQMELEIVLMLWRHREVDFSIARLAKYTLAMNAMCMNPRQFHGHDLIGTLQHHEPSIDYDFALTSLAVCSAEAHMRKRQIRRLIDIINGAQYQNIYTMAMVILALRCIIQDHRHHNLHHFVKKPQLSLAQRQRPDGSFGDLRTTALAMQALEQFDNEPIDNWNKSAAIIWLMNRQQLDGSFDNSIYETAETILGIIPKSFISIRTLNCYKNKQDSSANTPFHVELNKEWTANYSERSIHSVSADTSINMRTNVTASTLTTTPFIPFISINMTNNKREMVNVSYTLWIGTNETHHITVSAPKNGTFYGVMLLAADMSPQFQFIASEWPNGHYVHTLAGLKEEPMSYRYWLLYRLFSPPDQSSPPGNQLVAPGGVDDLEISGGEYYLFWYKKL